MNYRRRMPPKIDSRAVALAALAGLVAGAACKGSGPSNDSPVGSASAAIAARPGDKACCKGLNDCKGKGGCAVAGKHDCAGKNDCKGKGGCNMHCPN